MSVLHAALDRLLAEHDRLGTPLSACALPGKSEQETRERLEGLGLVAPSELVDWFAWHEFDAAAWSATGALGQPELFWMGWPMTLDQAVETYGRYESSVDRFMDPANPQPDEEQWRSTWFPIIWSSPADIVVECEGAADLAPSVRRVENGPTFPPGPAAPVIFESLLGLAEAAVRLIRDQSEWSSGAFALRNDAEGRIERA